MKKINILLPVLLSMLCVTSYVSAMKKIPNFKKNSVGSMNLFAKERIIAPGYFEIMGEELKLLQERCQNIVNTADLLLNVFFKVVEGNEHLYSPEESETFFKESSKNTAKIKLYIAEGDKKFLHYIEKMAMNLEQKFQKIVVDHFTGGMVSGVEKKDVFKKVKKMAEEEPKNHKSILQIVTEKYSRLQEILNELNEKFIEHQELACDDDDDDEIFSFEDECENCFDGSPKLNSASPVFKNKVKEKLKDLLKKEKKEQEKKEKEKQVKEILLIAEKENIDLSKNEKKVDALPLKIDGFYGLPKKKPLMVRKNFVSKKRNFKNIGLMRVIDVMEEIKIIANEDEN